MRTRDRRFLAVTVIILAGAGALVGLFFLSPGKGGCFTLDGVTKTQLRETGFGAIAKFQLPSPQRSPNAIVVASDGSVWFGEEAIPGIAHFFPANGTLIEYPWPSSYSTSGTSGHSCTYKTDIWGVALWNGGVWATDTARNELVGLNPKTGSFTQVPLGGNDSYPYTLTTGPGGALWFAQVLSGDVGTLFANGTVREHSVQFPTHLGNTSMTVNLPGAPAQVAFVNSTLGYYLDVAPVTEGSALFAFNPGSFHPEKLGGNQTLYSPDSISLGAGGIWVAEHGASDVAFYNLTSGRWAVFPTSWVGYVRTTLPYFIEASGTSVWFNEHYGNKMAVLDWKDGLLTEYSLSNPPASNLSQIDNALTFALGGNLAWFTEYTSNDVGFVNASAKPSFSVRVSSASMDLRPGQAGSLNLTVEGRSSTPLFFLFADSESTYSKPQRIQMAANVTNIGPLDGARTASVSIQVPADFTGDYTLLVTVTDGLVYRTAFVRLHVGG